MSINKPQERQVQDLASSLHFVIRRDTLPPRSLLQGEQQLSSYLQHVWEMSINKPQERQVQDLASSLHFVIRRDTLPPRSLLPGV